MPNGTVQHELLQIRKVDEQTDRPSKAVQHRRIDSRAAGVQLLDAEVTRQAAILAYLQTFRLMMFLVLVMLPLALLLRSPRVQRVGMPGE